MKTNTSRGAAFFIASFALIMAPQVAGATTISSAPLFSLAAKPAAPLYLYIPSIKLLSNVEGVGVNEKGNMDVPSGKSNSVGWYQYGVVPGGVGTAVIDAHNTAAFKNLKDLAVGQKFYIKDAKGAWLAFKVTKSQVYSMKTLQPSTLFAATNSRQVNLITCAGINLGNGEATHRLIVSAELV
ncbi:class F sortase [Candidatus Parcubacteria bacterium]|nr:class F sortase [Candidatus Parcubacteria bacterium]